MLTFLLYMFVLVSRCVFVSIESGTKSHQQKAAQAGEALSRHRMQLVRVVVLQAEHARCHACCFNALLTVAPVMIDYQQDE